MVWSMASRTFLSKRVSICFLGRFLRNRRSYTRLSGVRVLCRPERGEGADLAANAAGAGTDRMLGLPLEGGVVPPLCANAAACCLACLEAFWFFFSILFPLFSVSLSLSLLFVLFVLWCVVALLILFAVDVCSIVIRKKLAPL